MKKTYLGLMGLFLLPQTALAVDAAAPASTSVSSPLAALWRVLLTPITVPHLPWQLPLLAPVALVLVLLLLIFCLLARRGGYRRGFREGERVVMRQMAREEQEAAVPPMPHRPAPQQPAAPPTTMLFCCLPPAPAARDKNKNTATAPRLAQYQTGAGFHPGARSFRVATFYRITILRPLPGQPFRCCPRRRR